MNNEWNDVRNFHLRFGHPVAKAPIKVAPERALKRYNWMLEEINAKERRNDSYTSVTE